MMLNIYIFANILAVILAQATIHPDGDYTTAPGNNATFICSPLLHGVVAVNWLANSTPLLQEVPTVTFRGNQLILTQIPPSYNYTIISCEAMLTSGAMAQSTNNVTIRLFEHFPSAAPSLNISFTNSSLHMTWESSALQSNNTITYCIDILNSTSIYPTHSVCGITTTEYIYNLPPKYWCEVYFIYVNPVNRGLHGATRARRFAELTDHKGPEVMKALHMPGTLDDTSNNTQYCLLYMSARVCNSQLTVQDLSAGKVFDVPESSVKIVENNITFNSDKVLVNRLYRVFVVAENRAELLASNKTFSTHDVENVGFEINNGVKVTATYLSHSSADGALFHFVFIADSGDVDFSKSFFMALDRIDSHNHTLPFELYPGNYTVHVYDIEHDGTLHNGEGYPAVSRNITIPTGHPELSSTEKGDCEVPTAIPDHIITVQCTFPTDATVTNIQVIVQSTSASEVHKIYANRSVDLNTPVLVPVEKDGEYRVTVFPIRGRMGILDSFVLHQEVVSTNNETTTSVPKIPMMNDNDTLLPVVTLSVFVSISLLMMTVIPVVAFWWFKKNCTTRTYKPRNMEFWPKPSPSLQRIPQKRTKPISIPIIYTDSYKSSLDPESVDTTLTTLESYNEHVWDVTIRKTPPITTV